MTKITICWLLYFVVLYNLWLFFNRSFIINYSFLFNHNLSQIKFNPTPWENANEPLCSKYEFNPLRNGHISNGKIKANETETSIPLGVEFIFATMREDTRFSHHSIEHMILCVQVIEMGCVATLTLIWWWLYIHKLIAIKFWFYWYPGRVSFYCIHCVYK